MRRLHRLFSKAFAVVLSHFRYVDNKEVRTFFFDILLLIDSSGGRTMPLACFLIREVIMVSRAGAHMIGFTLRV